MSLYDTDYFAGTRKPAHARRTGRLENVDLGEIAGEIEDLGKSERRALESALSQLLMYLLMWDFQPQQQSSSWQASIRKQWPRIRRITNENPSLSPCLEDAAFVEEAYQDAADDAAIETGLDRAHFPRECPYARADFDVVR